MHGVICAALSLALDANGHNLMPSAVAGAIIMRASWPAPITPTTGNSDFTALILDEVHLLNSRALRR